MQNRQNPLGGAYVTGLETRAELGAFTGDATRSPVGSYTGTGIPHGDGFVPHRLRHLPPQTASGRPPRGSPLNPGGAAARSRSPDLRCTSPERARAADARMDA
jgi:hypothetical protein